MMIFDFQKKFSTIWYFIWFSKNLLYLKWLEQSQSCKIVDRWKVLQNIFLKCLFQIYSVFINTQDDGNISNRAAFAADYFLSFAVLYFSFDVAFGIMLGMF